MAGHTAHNQLHKFIMKLSLIENLFNELPIKPIIRLGQINLPSKKPLRAIGVLIIMQDLLSNNKLTILSEICLLGTKLT